jgi:hypothetical protein
MLIKVGMYKAQPKNSPKIDLIAIPDKNGVRRWKNISSMKYTGKRGDDFDRLERYYIKHFQK